MGLSTKPPPSNSFNLSACLFVALVDKLVDDVVGTGVAPVGLGDYLVATDC